MQCAHGAWQRGEAPDIGGEYGRPRKFEIPVCNIFKPRIYLDQLCYETNLQDLKDSQKIGKQLEKGLTLVLDFNEERQFYNIMEQNESQTMNALYPDNDDVAIYLDTISL